MVIRYAYLWKSEHRRGQEEGVKDRPCAIVLSSVVRDGETVVTVLPVTHSAPRDASSAVELPAATKRRLGLDEERSWIVVSEANQFIWPGPDLRFPAGAGLGEVVYGFLPGKFQIRVREAFLTSLIARRAALVRRSD